MIGLPRPLAAASMVMILAPGIGTSPLAAQEAAAPAGTHARQGLAIGAIAGGALGFAAFTVLGLGLCESSSCSADAVQLGLLGGVMGAAGGGLTGLVIGAAIPRRGETASDGVTEVLPEAPGGSRPAEAEGPVGEGSGNMEDEPQRQGRWIPVISVGRSFGSEGEFEGGALWASAALLRPTTTRDWWGVEVGHLGRRAGVEVSTGTGADVTTITRWAHTLWSGSLVAARSVGDGPSPWGYLLASVGVYRYRRTFDYTRTPAVPGDNGRTTENSPYPGFSVGGGGAWRVASAMHMGVESRIHLPVGAGDGLSPLVTLGGTLRFHR